MKIRKNNLQRINADKSLNVETCKNGQLTIVVEKDGCKRYIHSKYDPSKEAQDQTAEFIPEVREKLLILVFGLGMGYHIKEIMSSLPEGGNVYVFEPCPYICRLFIENGGETLLDDDRFHLFTYKSSEELRQDLPEILSIENCDAMYFFVNPAYCSIFPEKHDELVTEINNFSSELLSQKQSIRKYGPDWGLNVLYNYKHIVTSASVMGLFGLCKGKTAVIVSAGPSLSKNIALLSRVENDALILCADTAYKALEAKGIRPHLIFSTSGSIKAPEKLLGSSYGDIPLVYKWQTAFKTLGGHSGRKFYASNMPDFMEDSLKEAGARLANLESGGSVACTCLDFAAKAGAKTIILIGQDFAFAEGQTHAMGVVGLISPLNLDSPSTAEGIDGRPVATLKVFDIYRLWFEKYIDEHKNIRFIDATEGGALIKGTEIMPLDKALDLYLCDKFDFEEEIEKAFQKNPLLSKKGKKLMAQNYKQAYEDFLKAKELLKDIINAYKKPPLSRHEVISFLDKLDSFTPAVKYTLLKDIFDLKNMVLGRNVEEELRLFKEISYKLNYLSPPFEDLIKSI